MRNLITAQEVIDLAFAENSNMMEESISDTAIRIAEIKYIRPAFGVMYPLLADKYADYTNDYVKPALAYFVKCEIVSSIAIDMSNSGVAVANPQYQSAASDKQRQRLYDSEMSKAKTLLDFALEYIAENKELFPDFNGEAPKKHHRLGGLLLGDSTSRNQSASIAGEAFNNELKQLSREVSGKVDKVEGKGLSTNDFTDEYKKKVDEFSGGGDETIIPITHASLLVLRNAGELTKGAFYRITDYECTTVQADSRSANHPFDIIVQALDERTLSENAQAVAREGDEYYANCNLGAWQLKYTIDNDATRHSWAQERIVEQPQKWECSFGVLEESYNNNNSTGYKEAIIDNKTWYLYKPSNPTSHLDQYLLYRKEAVGEAITSVDELIFVSNEAPTYDEDTAEWSWPEYINVITPNGTHIADLHNDWDSNYYDDSDSDQECLMSFSTDFRYDEELGMYRYPTPDGAEYWWSYIMGGAWGQVNYIPYNGDTKDLSYAFESPLPKYGRSVYKATDGLYIYTTATEDKNYEEEIDRIIYTAYVAPREEGKGVIYCMIDEHNNRCPFDFKNMQFLNNKEWYYAFSFKGTDISITDYCYDNYFADNKATPWDNTTTPVPVTLPMLILNAKPNASGKTSGIANCHFVAGVKKGYVSATRIENFEWKPRMGGSLAIIENIYINLSGLFYGNSISGCCKNFKVGTENAPASAFYDNEIHLATYQTSDFTCNASTFVNNKLNLTESSAGFVITAGSMTSCNITNAFYEKGKYTDKINFGANAIIRDCVIKMYNALTINYANTTSTTEPLRFLNIDASGWNDSTITIPATFPKNASYELKVAKNSDGVIKMWCDADLAN